MLRPKMFLARLSAAPGWQSSQFALQGLFCSHKASLTQHTTNSGSLRVVHTQTIWNGNRASLGA